VNRWQKKKGEEEIDLPIAPPMNKKETKKGTPVSEDKWTMLPEHHPSTDSIPHTTVLWRACATSSVAK
jgi:hypothetical protein